MDASSIGAVKPTVESENSDLRQVSLQIPNQDDLRVPSRYNSPEPGDITRFGGTDTAEEADSGSDDTTFDATVENESDATSVHDIDESDAASVASGVTIFEGIEDHIDESDATVASRSLSSKELRTTSTRAMP